MIEQICFHCRYTFKVEKKTIKDVVRCPICRRPVTAGIGVEDAEAHVKEAHHEQSPPLPKERGESA